MAQSSWKDYAVSGNGHHTNYAYEPFEQDPRGMPPLPPGAPRGHYAHPQMAPHPNGSLQKPPRVPSSSGNVNGSYSSRAPGGPVPPNAGYSLPRHHHSGYGHHHGPPPPPPGYGSYDRRGYHGRPSDFPPDHYFMPSQRKYSGEVVRVFVDYNNK